MKNKISITFCLLSCMFLLACSWPLFLTSDNSHISDTSNLQTSLFSDSEKNMLTKAVVDNVLNLNLPIQIPAANFYRFDLVNDSSAHRLSVIFKESALKTIEYSLQTTAKVLLFDEKQRLVNHKIDYFVFEQMIPKTGLDKVVNVLNIPFQDINFIFNNSMSIASHPSVLPVLTEIANTISDPGIASMNTVLTGGDAKEINFLPNFDGFSEKTVIEMMLSEELRSFFLSKVGQNKSQTTKLFHSNVGFELRGKRFSLTDANTDLDNCGCDCCSELASVKIKLEKPTYEVTGNDLNLLLSFDYGYMSNSGIAAGGNLNGAALRKDGKIIPCKDFREETSEESSKKYEIIFDLENVDPGAYDLLLNSPQAEVVKDYLQDMYYYFKGQHYLVFKSAINVSSEKITGLQIVLPKQQLLIPNQKYVINGEDFTGGAKAYLRDFPALFLSEESPFIIEGYDLNVVSSSRIECYFDLQSANDCSKLLIIQNPDGRVFVSSLVTEKTEETDFKLISVRPAVFENSGILSSETKMYQINVPADIPRTGMDIPVSLFHSKGEAYGLSKGECYLVADNAPTISGKVEFMQRNGSFRFKDVDLSGLCPGYYHLKLYYPLNTEESLSLENAILITSPGPVISNLSVSSGNTGETIPITIQGSNFFLDTQITLRGQNYSINLENSKLTNTGEISGTLSLPIITQSQKFDVITTNSDGKSAILPQGFIIVVKAKELPTPVISSITPSTSIPNELVRVSIAGENFQHGVAIQLKKDGEEPIIGQAIEFPDASTMSCSFDLQGKAEGIWNLTVSNSDGKSSTLTNAFSINTPIYSAPSITSTSPVTAENSGYKTIWVVGNHFRKGIKAVLVKEGSTNILNTSMNIVSETSLNCSFKLTGIAVGNWNLVVTNDDGKSATLANCLTITSVPLLAPTLSSVLPNDGVNNNSKSVRITGTNFRDGLSVALTKPGEIDILGGSLNLVSANSLNCTFDLDGKAVGIWNLVVTNSDGQSVTLNNGFSVIAAPLPAPTISLVTPTSGVNNETKSMTINGSNFRDGFSVKLAKSSEEDISGTNLNLINGNSFSCIFDLNGKASGAWNLIITNSDGQSATLSNGFSIAEASWPEPSISSVSPISGIDNSFKSITISGTNFRNGVSAKLTKSGEVDISGESINLANSNTLSCSFNLNGKAIGSWNLVVSNSDGKQSVLANGFTISAAALSAPTLATVSPITGLNNSSKSVTISGTNFREGVSAKLVKTGEADILGYSINLVSSSSLTCSFNLVNKIAGDWNLIITNTDGQSAALANGFQIRNPNPTVTFMEPYEEHAGKFMDSVKITGNGFTSSGGIPVVTLTQNSQTLTATNVTVSNTSEIQCKFDLSGLLGDSMWDLNVTLPYADKITKANSFWVFPPL